MQPIGNEKIKVVDVSHYQGTIDFKKMYADGVRAVYIKATEGVTYDDPMMVTYVTAAKAAGLLVGLYHFARPDQDTAVDEANHFVTKYKSVPVDLLPAFDIEEPTDASTMTADALVKWVQTWVATVEKALGCEVMIYTGVWFINRFGDFEQAFKSKKLWISYYAAGTIPNAGGWTTYTMWQYASDGIVAGVSGDVDMDLLAVPLSSIMRYPPVKVALNGVPFHDGIVVGTDTYIIWTALQKLNVPYALKSYGVITVNGVDVTGVVYNGDTYLPWSVFNVDSHWISDRNWNFTSKSSGGTLGTNGATTAGGVTNVPSPSTTNTQPVNTGNSQGNGNATGVSGNAGGASSGSNTQDASKQGAQAGTTPVTTPISTAPSTPIGATQPVSTPTNTNASGDAQSGSQTTVDGVTMSDVPSDQKTFIQFIIDLLKRFFHIGG